MYPTCFSSGPYGQQNNCRQNLGIDSTDRSLAAHSKDKTHVAKQFATVIEKNHTEKCKCRANQTPVAGMALHYTSNEKYTHHNIGNYSTNWSINNRGFRGHSNNICEIHDPLLKMRSDTVSKNKYQ